MDLRRSEYVFDGFDNLGITEGGSHRVAAWVPQRQTSRDPGSELGGKSGSHVMVMLSSRGRYLLREEVFATCTDETACLHCGFAVCGN